MKRAITTLMATLLLGLAFTSCEKENIAGGNNGGENNNGTIFTDDATGIELNMSNSGSDKISFETSYISISGHIDIAYIHLTISSSNNFDLYSNISSSYMEYDIASIGSVTSLSTITNIPTSGWVKQIAVNPGTGYVIRYKGQGFEYTYARLYVKDWIVSTSGGIIGATVVYQDKWGQTGGHNDESLFGTSWSGSTVDTIDGITYTHFFTFRFSESSFTGTATLENHTSSGDHDTYSPSFTYTFGNNHGNLTMIFPDMSSSEWPVFSFVVEGSIMTLTNTDTDPIILHST